MSVQQVRGLSAQRTRGFSRFLYAVSLKAVIASIQARGVVIFAIDTRFVTRKRAGFEEEQRLGLESGGRFFEFGSDKELQNAFRSIQAQLKISIFLHTPLRM